MKSYKVYQVDSFTQEKFHGNPAGVVSNADGLSDAQMLKIARELNNSETAFIFSSLSSDYDVEVRFFTPTTEVPLCGHATIAAHYVRAIEGEHTEGRIIQKTKAGLLPIDILQKDGDYTVIMTMGEPEVSEPIQERIVQKIVSALGISMRDLREDCPVSIASAGHSKVMVGIKRNELLHSLKPNMEQLIEISEEVDCNGFYVFTVNPEDDILVHGRMFAPAIGITEDPVTGNANGPLGIYLVHYGICQEHSAADHFDFQIIQGEAIGRDGTMHVHVKKENGHPIQVQITGRAVIVFATDMTI